jgi:hypothetical protein
MWIKFFKYIAIAILCYFVYENRNSSDGMLMNIFIGLLITSMIVSVVVPITGGKYKSAIIFIGTFLYSLIIMYLTLPLKIKFKLSDTIYLAICGISASICVFLIPKISNYFKLSEKRVYFALSAFTSVTISIFQVFIDSDLFKPIMASDDFFLSAIYKNYYKEYKISKEYLDVIWKLIVAVFAFYFTILIEYKSDK